MNRLIAIHFEVRYTFPTDKFFTMIFSVKNIIRTCIGVIDVFFCGESIQLKV